MLKAGLVQPVLQANFAEPGPCSRDERALVELGSEVARVRVDHNLALVLARDETLSDQFVEAELLRAGHFNRAIQWRADGDSAYSFRDVFSRHRLNQDRRQADRRSVGRFIGDALDELEELRC